MRIGTPGSMSGGMGVVSGMATQLLGTSGPPVANAAYYFDAERDTYTDVTLLIPTSANNDPVGGWKDQTVNARHILNNILGTKPTIKYSQVNGLKCVSGDTNGTCNLTKAFTLAQPVTVFLVMRLNIWNTTKAYLMDGAGDTMDLITLSGTSPQMKLFAGTGSTNTNGDLTIATWGIVCCVYNGASSQLRVNAGTAATGNPGSSTTGGLTLFHYGGSFGGVTGANVDIATCIGYGSALSTSDETLVRNWLNGIYAIF